MVNIQTYYLWKLNLIKVIMKNNVAFPFFVFKKDKKGKSGKEEVCGYNRETDRCSRKYYPHQKERCELNQTTKRCKKKELD